MANPDNKDQEKKSESVINWNMEWDKKIKCSYK